MMTLRQLMWWMVFAQSVKAKSILCSRKLPAMSNPLHTLLNQAHPEDRDRLVGQMEQADPRSGRQPVSVSALMDVVRDMNPAAITPTDALQAFAQHPIPGFSFDRWLLEMVDEGIYLQDLYNEAA